VIACVIIADFAVAVERQRNTALGDAPLVLIHYIHQKPKVYAACAEARSMGVKVDMALSRASSLCPLAHFISASPSLYRREAQKFLDTLLAFTDRIEIEQTNALCLWLDIGKVSPHEASQIASKLLQAVSDNTPFFSSVGLADGKFTARIASIQARSGKVLAVASGNEANFLATLPIRHLALSNEMARQLDLLGIETLGQYGILPHGAVLHRFKKVGGHLHRLANGYDTRTITRYVPPLSEHIKRYFDDPIDNRLIIQNFLTQLANELATRLQSQGLAASSLTFALHCENARLIETSHQLREPINDALLLFQSVNRLFGKLTLFTDVTGLEIHLDNLKPPAPKQMDFFGLLEGETYSVTEVVKHLAGRHGTEPFYQIVPNKHPGYLPEDQARLERVEIA
jgi:DNA polymerase-4